VSTEVPSRVREIMGEVLGVAPELIAADSAVGALEGWDSFTHLQALLALEDAFGIQFDDQEEIPDLTTVANIVHELGVRGVTF
jgi:acyl carrier protein